MPNVQNFTPHRKRSSPKKGKKLGTLAQQKFEREETQDERVARKVREKDLDARLAKIRETSFS